MDRYTASGDPATEGYRRDRTTWAAFGAWPQIQDEISYDLLGRRIADGHAVLVATHDVEFVAQVADSVVVLAGGEVVSAGPTGRVLAESPAFAPQVSKVLGPDWLTVDQVEAALV